MARQGKVIALAVPCIFAAAAFAGAAARAGAPFGHTLRSDFFYAANFTQLNHGAYGGTPRPVIAAQYGYVAQMEEWIDNWMNGPTGYRGCIIAARTLLAGIVGANVNDTVLVDNASEAINDILRNLDPPLGPGDFIFDLSTEYAPFAAFYTWLGTRQGVQTMTANITWPVSGDESFIVPVQQTLAAANASGSRIRIAVVSQISAYPSVLLPVPALVAMFHSYGIPVVVDGAHALGNVAFDISTWNDVDYALWNLHKWYFAPKSSALMYVRQDHQGAHVPAPSVVDNTEDIPFTDRFIWTGTRDRTAFCAILAAKDYRDSLGGEAAIQNYTQYIALHAKKYLENAWGVVPMSPDSMATSMSIVQLPTSNATLCGIIRGALINQYGLGVSGWAPVGQIQCYVRISGQVYLDETDISRLGDAVLAIIHSQGV